MTLTEYLSMPIEILAKQDTKDVRRAVENAVNCFGFKPEEIVARISLAAGLVNAIALCLFCAKYETEQQRWIDGRNEYSHMLLDEIYRTEEFADYMYKFCGYLTEDAIVFFENLSKEIGTQLHRTNLQTFASFILFVLGTQADKALGDKIKEIRKMDEKFWRMPMI